MEVLNSCNFPDYSTQGHQPGRKNILRFAWIGKEKPTGVLGGAVSPSVGSVGDQGVKPLVNLQYLAYDTYDIGFYG